MILIKPAGLERLAVYTESSTIPPVFAEAVGATWPRVKADIHAQRVDPKKYFREIADRLFRSRHPFTTEVEAGYATHLGMAIGLSKKLRDTAVPEVLQRALEFPMGETQRRLCESIYETWGRVVQYEKQTHPTAYPLKEQPLVLVKLITGYIPSGTRLKQARLFMDDHYLDPSNTRDLLFVAGKV